MIFKIIPQRSKFPHQNFTQHFPPTLCRIFFRIKRPFLKLKAAVLYNFRTFQIPQSPEVLRHIFIAVLIRKLILFMNILKTYGVLKRICTLFKSSPLPIYSDHHSGQIEKKLVPYFYKSVCLKHFRRHFRKFFFIHIVLSDHFFADFPAVAYGGQNDIPPFACLLYYIASDLSTPRQQKTPRHFCPRRPLSAADRSSSVQDKCRKISSRHLSVFY